MHLLRLASGLDSLVVGKREIFDEIVHSITNAKRYGASGDVLNKLFEKVLRLATRLKGHDWHSKQCSLLGDVAVKLVMEKQAWMLKRKC